MQISKTYKVTLTGQSPLIMHKDNIDWSEKIKRWQTDPNNKADSHAGDDRSPAWTWIGSLYCDRDNTNIYMDSDNLMTMLREGGAKVSTGKGKSTYKAATQSGLLITSLGSPFFVNGVQIPKGKILDLEGERDFQKHEDVVKSLGFELLVKRAKVGMSKHIRVRPMFRNWKVETFIEVLDEGKSGITKEVLQRILDEAGSLCGLGDWRPSSRTPGKFGRFTAEVEDA